MEGQPEVFTSGNRDGSEDSQNSSDSSDSGDSYYGIITSYTRGDQQIGIPAEDRGQSSPHEVEDRKALQKQWAAMRNEALRKIGFKAFPYLLQAGGDLAPGTPGNAMYVVGVGWQGSESVYLVAKQMKLGLDGDPKFNGMVLVGSLMQVVGAGLRAAGNVEGLSSDQQKWLMVGGNTLIGAGAVVSCFPDPPQPQGASKPSTSVAQAARELQPPIVREPSRRDPSSNPQAASLRRRTTISSSSSQPGASGSGVVRGRGPG
ncbi:hypothetical protein AB0E08_13610 [Streptomyces sp. NPDC048281]|uniref:hypothetical protein n=1 Tax=Streptomyces sp. NPDC048281 TaxID=3154715 RepID=UPI00343DAD80